MNNLLLFFFQISQNVVQIVTVEICGSPPHISAKFMQKQDISWSRQQMTQPLMKPPASSETSPIMKLAAWTDRPLPCPYLEDLLVDHLVDRPLPCPGLLVQSVLIQSVLVQSVFNFASLGMRSDTILRERSRENTTSPSCWLMPCIGVVTWDSHNPFLNHFILICTLS